MGHMALTEDRRSLTGMDDWRRRLYDAALSAKASNSTISGLPNDPLYGPDNVEIDYENDLGYPGVYPFTRGVYPSMYRGSSGRCASSPASAPRPERTSASGTSSSTARPGSRPPSTCLVGGGYDSDHPRSLGEVGREGVAVDSLDDMETLFSGIPLGGSRRR